MIIIVQTVQWLRRGYQGEDTDNMAEAVLTRENPEVCGQVIKELTAGQDRKTGNYNDFGINVIM